MDLKIYGTLNIYFPLMRYGVKRNYTPSIRYKLVNWSQVAKRSNYTHVSGFQVQEVSYSCSLEPHTRVRKPVIVLEFEDAALSYKVFLS